MAAEPALHREDHVPSGFRWVEPDDYSHAALAFLRVAAGERPVLVLINFTPVHWDDYLVGVPEAGSWEVLASSADAVFGGFGAVTGQLVETETRPNQGFGQALALTLPPLSATFMAPIRNEKTVRSEKT
jgi:1,4-alpha-glucan branching enzyme